MTDQPVEFAQRTEPFRRELLAHCYRILGSADEAEDLVQETYLRAWRSYGTFEDRSSVTPTLANGQPAAAAYYRDSDRTRHALGVAVRTATPAGIARITVFAGGPGLLAKFGFPPTQSERGQ